MKAIILAAGKGSRMKSDTPKVLHKIANFTMLEHLIITLKSVPEISQIRVVGNKHLFEHPEFIEINSRYQFASCEQKEQKGTAHALSCGLVKNDDSDILVLNGDTPFITSSTLQKLITKRKEASITVLGLTPKEPTGYGRLVMDDSKLVRIVEERDATSQEKAISLCNSNIMLIDGRFVHSLLLEVKPQNSQKEFYLTDIIRIANEKGLRCSSISTNSWQELMGINDRVQLSQAEGYIQDILREKAMFNGVTLIDPNSTFLSLDTKIESDVILYPGVYIGTGVTIERSARILPYSHLEGVHIGKNAQVGPFSRIRPNSQISKNTKVGNFVEVKNSSLKEGTKANHLAYIGDAQIGGNSNIGAGTVFCNYDGKQKHRTHVGAKVFIGSNSSLIAPVTIRDNSLVAAGSVITKDVEKGSLAIARSYQTNKPRKK